MFVTCASKKPVTLLLSVNPNRQIHKSTKKIPTFPKFLPFIHRSYYELRLSIIFVFGKEYDDRFQTYHTRFIMDVMH